MEFVKKNYEKIILSIVLLGLVGVVGFLPVLIASDHDKMVAFKMDLINPKVPPLPDLDMSNQDVVLARVKSATPLDFSTTNRLFNPVMWQKDKNGNLIKIVTGSEIGPTAAVITKITPLYFVIALQSANTNEISPRYVISAQNQAAEYPDQRRPKPYYISVGEKNSVFGLKDIKGPPANPTALDLVLADSGQAVTISADNPYRRVEGYMADLKYAPENVTANNLRANGQLNFAGDEYNVIAIDENDVILLAQSNQKKYVLPYSP